MPIQRLTQEEIARQFELPERKSKIATILKQDGQAYCICRSSDSSRFMIGCDGCEEWYHGDCIGITEKESKNIKHYYCEKCQEEDPTLETKFKSSKPSENEPRRDSAARGRPRKELHSYDPEFVPDTPVKKSKSSSSKLPCGHCANCRKTINCGSCYICKEIKRSGARKVKEKCVNRICVRLKTSYKRHDIDDSSSDGEITSRTVGSSVKPGMQCYGPGCVEVALPNSKYCSEKCGLQLAKNRIFQVLPQRLQEWSMSSSYAEEVNKRDLDTVRRKQSEARDSLHELDIRYQKLEMIIERGKILEPSTVKADSDPRKSGKRGSFRGNKLNEKEEEASVYCVTCGHEIHTSSAIKHMEKCFSKYESQASFGSMYKTRIEGNNMFCDFYNAGNKTYCKRLRVLCPEHTKDPVIGNNEACGCPLAKNVFEETTDLCTQPKKLCFKHYCWEKLRRAEIDMERVRQWLKIDELFEQERQIRQRLVQRAGVLALMLHSTYDHDAMEKMTSAQEEERLQQLEKTLRKNYDKEQFENIKCTKQNIKFFKSLKKVMSAS